MAGSTRSSRRRRPRQQVVDAEVAKQRRLSTTDSVAWAEFAGRDSYSGKSVNLRSAMQLATVWACVRLTAQMIASLPIGMFEKRADGSRVGSDSRVGEVIGFSPNADQTAFEYWETKVAWLMATGNAYSERTEFGGRLSSLQPIASTHCRPKRRDDGELVYAITDRGKTEDLPREKVFHLKGFGFGGDLGLSPIAYGIQTFGNAMATDESAGKIFGNGLNVSGVLSSDQHTLKPDQRRQLQEIMSTFAGSTNAGKLMILEAGLKYQQMTLNPEDAQMLETRRFNIEEICRWFGMPPIIIGHAAQGQTMWGSGVEQILLAWLATGINPILRRIEARIQKDLVPSGERRRVYGEFNREGLLQMDSAAKASFLSSMTQNGLMTRNEGRAKLNLENRPEANGLTAQTSLAPLETLGAKSSGDAARAALRNWLNDDNPED